MATTMPLRARTGCLAVREKGIVKHNRMAQRCMEKSSDLGGSHELLEAWVGLDGGALTGRRGRVETEFGAMGTHRTRRGWGIAWL